MTKALLVNNDSDTWQELVAVVEDCGLEFDVKHCMDIDASSGDGYDVVILSGGWWYDEAARHLEAYGGELELIRKTSTPILGICIGMQLMQIAYSGSVPLLDSPQKDLQTISLTYEGQRWLDLPSVLTVHKNHTMGVIAVADGFIELANSPGHVEIIRHLTRPLLGVQFHPEIGEVSPKKTLMEKLIKAAMSLPSEPPLVSITKRGK